MHSCNGMLINALLNTVSFRMTLSDLEWLSKIFSDAKHRTAFLRPAKLLLWKHSLSNLIKLLTCVHSSISKLHVQELCWLFLAADGASTLAQCNTVAIKSNIRRRWLTYCCKQLQLQWRHQLCLRFRQQDRYNAAVYQCCRHLSNFRGWLRWSVRVKV